MSAVIADAGAGASADPGADRSAPAGAAPSSPPSAKQRRWRRVKRLGTVVFFALVATLLYTQAREVEWAEVGGAMRQLPGTTLAMAIGLAVASHALYSSFDLIGRHETGHRLGVRPVMTVTLISYAFNLNLGSLVGGIAFRYRLYSRLGLDNADTTRVLGLSLVTNWLGYLMLGGLVFAFFPLELPPDWRLDGAGLRILGGAMVAVAIAYLCLCAFSKNRSVSIRGHGFALPSGRIALLQLALSMCNWALMGAIVWLLLRQQLPYPAVLGVLLVAAIAGVVTHVPAGLGVLEAVFVALLGHLLGRGELIGALLAYRCLYYLAPLGVASVVYFVVEARARRIAATAASPAPTT